MRAPVAHVHSRHAAGGERLMHPVVEEHEVHAARERRVGARLEVARGEKVRILKRHRRVRLSGEYRPSRRTSRGAADLRSAADNAFAHPERTRSPELRDGHVARPRRLASVERTSVRLYEELNAARVQAVPEHAVVALRGKLAHGLRHVRLDPLRAVRDRADVSR